MPDFGAEEENTMKKQIRYTKAPKDIDEAILSSRKVADFLPAPEELAGKERSVKVTLSLNKDSVDFFKQQAKIYGYPYQKMIRKLVNIYAKQHSFKKH